MPNAIILAYHGPANYASEPFSWFFGNTILSSLGLSSYPTGIIDRTTGIQSRSAWVSLMNSRNNVPATVAIDMSRNYNPISRQFSASIDFTALQNLTGQYKFNVILLEDGIVWAQNGSLGGPNYVHDWTVRDMMNGALGEEVINGTWNQGQLINKTVNYTVPVPSGGGPDIVPDSCNVVVMVYQVGSPLNAAAEIQQAEQWTLISPDYVATMSSQSPDVIASNTTLANYSATIHNLGLMQDKYYFTLNMNTPGGWSGEFTTNNGTFQAGDIDSVEVVPGDSTTVTVSVNPNAVDGYGQAMLEFLSANNPGVTDVTTFRFVTETGMTGLVIDATEGLYVDSLTTSLDNYMLADYGVASRTALHAANVNLDNFDMLFWTAGRSLPALYPEEVTALQTYLDNGGNLLVAGQDFGNDIFGANASSQHAQSFYNNYLHANFVSNASLFFLLYGVTGDLIGDGLRLIVSGIYDRSPDMIAPFDGQASSIFTYMTNPANIAGIRAAAGNYKVVYLGLGFEQISDAPNNVVGVKDSILARSIRWFEEGTVGIDDNQIAIHQFELAQNYPNPFNPETVIKYSLDNQKAEQTTLLIFNALGQVVRRLVDQPQAAGNYEISWNARDDYGNPVASGVYYYQLKSAEKRAVQKMVLVR